MEGWKTEKFKKLIDYKSGYNWSKEQELAVEEPNSIRVLTVSNVQDKLDLTSELYLAGVSELDKIKKQVSKDWSIAVSSNGNRNRIGNAIFIDSDTNYLFASFLTAFKPFDEADILPYYFYLWLSSSFVQRKITSVAEGTTGLGNLSIRFLRNMDITFPTDKAEQTAIAKILSTVDEAIRSTRDTISKLERVKKSLMQNLLSGKMKPDGTLRPAAEFYEDEKMGLVPKGWKSVKLKEVFFVNKETLPSKTNNDYEFRYITIETVNTESIDFESCLKYNFKEAPGRARRIIKDNDILISGVRPNLKAFAIYHKPNDENWICSTGFYVLSAKENVDPQFFFYQILSDIGAAQFHSWVAGTNYPAIGDSDIKNMLFFCPSYQEQVEISYRINGISRQQKKQQEKTTALEHLKKSLMQQLLTGRVRVK